MKAIAHLIEAKRFDMTESETLRDIAFCAHRIPQSDAFEVEDALTGHFDA
jgi:hypothetical protein